MVPLVVEIRVALNLRHERLKSRYILTAGFGRDGQGACGRNSWKYTQCYEP